MNDYLYSVERWFECTMDEMWQAWTLAHQLEHWYHPSALSNVPGATESDARPGGLWTVAVDVPMNGFIAYFYGEYTALEYHLRLEHTLHYTQSLNEFRARDMSTPSHRIVIDFEREDDGVVVRFTQYGEMPEDHIEQTQLGMESYFDSLADYLEV